MFTMEELEKLYEALTDFGDIVYNDVDDHDEETVRNLGECLTLINKGKRLKETGEC